MIRGAQIGVLGLVALIYGAHLGSSFHFDDAHTIVQNPYVHDVRNVPAFFAHPDMSSVLPANRTYRPVLFASLAFDWWLGNGNVIWFHVSTLVCFLALVWMILLLAGKVCGSVWPVPLFAVALFGLHPACAETVNYIVQRSEVLSTLGVVAGLVLYSRGSRWLCLIPVGLGMLAKPTAIVFPVLLFFYLTIIEREWPQRALRRCIRSLVVVAVLGTGCAWMTPVAFNPGAYSPWHYRMTQPLVALRFFGQFIVPTGLTADTDHTALTSIFDSGGIEGLLFVAGLIAVIAWASRRSDMRPIAFGLIWFLVALVPTSLMAVAEVENNHRMFFPSVGLAIAGAYGFHLLLSRSFPVIQKSATQNRTSTIRSSLISVAAVSILLVLSYGTWQRCEVWRTEAALWRDVTIKSPANGRGLMNYGLTLMAHGDYRGADYYFTRAAFFTPNYYILEINRGIVSAAMNRQAEADSHFQRAIALDRDATRIMIGFPPDSIPVRWLVASATRKTP